MMDLENQAVPTGLTLRQFKHSVISAELFNNGLIVA